MTRPQTRSPSPLTTVVAPPSSCGSSGYSVAWMPPKTTCAPRAFDQAADFVAAQGVAAVDADPDDVARRDGVDVEGLERFVGDDRVAVGRRRGRGQHIEPARGDDGHSEREMARIDQVNTHPNTLRCSVVTPSMKLRLSAVFFLIVLVGQDLVTPRIGLGARDDAGDIGVLARRTRSRRRGAPWPPRDALTSADAVRPGRVRARAFPGPSVLVRPCSSSCCLTTVAVTSGARAGDCRRHRHRRIHRHRHGDRRRRPHRIHRCAAPWDVLH